MCALLVVAAAASAAEIFARLHRAQIVQDIVDGDGNPAHDVVAADGWVVGTDAVGLVCGVAAALAFAVWLVTARADAASMRLRCADAVGFPARAIGNGVPGRGPLFGGWLLVVAAAAATQATVGGGVSLGTRQLMSSSLSDLVGLRDDDRASVVPTLAWIAVCGATITLVALVTRRQADRERELWVEAVYAHAAAAAEDPADNSADDPVVHSVDDTADSNTPKQRPPEPPSATSGPSADPNVDH
ncbi:hypothetical protein [Streptodolium elevatio]